jgi:hypothetical protein
MTREEVSKHEREYEAPAIVDLGSFQALTQSHGCLLGKQWGGSDGITFAGINVPISNCSA